jgi:hypothetical protein
MLDLDLGLDLVFQLSEIPLPTDDGDDGSFLATDSLDLAVQFEGGNVIGQIGTMDLGVVMGTVVLGREFVVLFLFRLEFGCERIAARLAVVAEPVALVIGIILVEFHLVIALLAPILPKVELVQTGKVKEARFLIFVVLALTFIIGIIEIVAVVVVVQSVAIVTAPFVLVILIFVLVFVSLQFVGWLTRHWQIGPTGQIAPQLIGCVLTVPQVTLQFRIGEIEIDNTFDLFGLSLIEIDTDIMLRLPECLWVEPDEVKSVEKAILVDLIEE